MALIQALLLLPLLASACAAGGDGSNPSVLQLPAVADVDIASGTALDYTVSPSATGTLLAGQDLMQVCTVYCMHIPGKLRRVVARMCSAIGKLRAVRLTVL